MSDKTWSESRRTGLATRANPVATNPIAPNLIVMAVLSAWQAVAGFYRRSAQRHQLTRLSDHQLRDIGLSRGDVDRELHKPFWRD